MLEFQVKGITVLRKDLILIYKPRREKCVFPALMCDDGGCQRDGVFVFSFPGADDSFPAAALERKSESHERETMLSPG